MVYLGRRFGLGKYYTFLSGLKTIQKGKEFEIVFLTMLNVSYEEGSSVLEVNCISRFWLITFEGSKENK